MSTNDKPLTTWSIWREGWAATGGYSDAQHLADIEAPTFQDACIKYYLLRPEITTFDPIKLTDWSCRLFDNEADARKSFG